jgi:phage shock protein PspC (stress-responsive transcriptional regulator)
MGLRTVEVGIMPVFCHKCGTGLPATARFCSNCGNTVNVAPPVPGRPLLRPHEGRQIAGVCLALARSNGWDVGVIRIVAVLGFIFSGGMVGVAYVAGWIGIPEEPYPIPGTPPPGL